ncbi:MAG: AAA family ATPase [Microbacteriaceae bacterium]
MSGAGARGPGALVGRFVILVDGGSGSGKTTLATRWAAELGAQLISLDDVYPGWDGLDAASALVAEALLEPAVGRWRSWDWEAGTPGSDWHRVETDRPLIVEGCGALSRAARARADLAVWLELDADVRRRRALDRDGETFAPYWRMWAEQEARFFERERPDRLADIVIDGTLLDV